MVDGLDVVAVGIEDERAVVARVVGGALTGRAVVRVARVDRGAVEGVDRLVRVHAERDVDVLGRRLAGDVRDRGVAGDDLDVIGLVDADLLARRQVEAPDGRDVTRAEPQMADRAGLALLARVHRFDAVAVRVAQEPAVVGGARLDAGAAERVDELVRRRGERDWRCLATGLPSETIEKSPQSMYSPSSSCSVRPSTVRTAS